MNEGNTEFAPSPSDEASAPKYASVKLGTPDNKAYAGVPQEDDPKVLDKEGRQKLNDEASRTLAGYVKEVWDTNVNLKVSNGTEAFLLRRLRQNLGFYEPEEEKSLLARGIPLVFVNITFHKTRTAIAWISEFFNNGNDVISIKPTPQPELPNELVKQIAGQTMKDYAALVQQTGIVPDPDTVFTYANQMRKRVEEQTKEKADEAATGMERQLKDDMIEGNWTERVEDYIQYLAEFGTAGFRCPVLRKKRVKSWGRNGLEVRERIKRTFEAISPFDLFPSSGMTDAENGDMCIRIRYLPRALAKMRGTPNWFDNAIDDLLSRDANGVMLSVVSDSEREMLNGQRNFFTQNNRVLEGFEFWGDVPGERLIKMGITATPEMEKITADGWYSVNCIYIDGNIVYCRVLSVDEDRPIVIGNFYRCPGKFFGSCPSAEMEPIQKICNACARSICMNMAYAARPQGMLDITQLSTNDDLKVRPGKMWQVRLNPAGNQSTSPLKFFTIPSVATELNNVFTYFFRLADEITGIPAYANGTDAATGAARTATGLNILFGAANRGIKKVVSNVNEVVEQVVKRLFWWHMKYNPNESIKGDLDIEVLGVKKFMARTSEAGERMNLISRISADPRLAQLQKPEQLARMMRQVALDLGIDPDMLAPAKDEVLQMVAQQQAQQAAQQQAMMASAQPQAAQQPQGGQLAAESPEPSQETTPTGRPKYAPRPDSGENEAEA